jgi:hypothetical protein
MKVMKLAISQPANELFLQSLLSVPPAGMTGGRTAFVPLLSSRDTGRWEHAFETMALACGKTQGAQGQCQLTRKVS